jgi:hypothetical protein
MNETARRLVGSGPTGPSASDIIDTAKSRLAEFARYRKMYEDFRPGMKNALAVEQWLRFLSGTKAESSHTFVMVPMGQRMDLSGLRMRAFREPKKPFFSNRSILDFLYERGVRTIVGIAAGPENVEGCSQITLSAIAMPIKPSDGIIFANIAGSHGIGLKHEEIEGTGWMAYAPRDQDALKSLDSESP